MGSSSSKSKVDQFVKSVMDVYTGVMQNSSTYLKNDQEIVIDSGGNIDLSNINLSQFASIDTSATQQAMISSETEQKIAELIKNTSDSLVQGLNVNRSSSETVTKMTTELANSIKTTFSQTCIASASNSQVTRLHAKGNVHLQYISMTQAVESVSKCTQTSTAVQKASTSLTTTVEALAKSVSKGVLAFLGDWGFLVVILLVVVVGGAFMLLKEGASGIRQMLKPPFIALAAAVLMGYATFAYFPLWKPYKQAPPNTKDAEGNVVPGETPAQKKARDNRNKALAIFAGTATLGLGAISVMLNRKSASK